MRIFFLKISYWGTRILFLLFFLFLIVLAIFFNRAAIHLGPIDLHNPFYFLNTYLNWWVYLLLYFSLVFILNTWVFLGFTLFFRFYKRRKQKRINRYEQIYTDHVIEYLYSADSQDAPARDVLLSIKNRARKKYQKLILLDILRRIHVQVKDDLKTKTAQMLTLLQLEKWVGTLIYSPYFGDKILAMKTISDFQMPGYDHYILKLSLNRNYVLRTEAFIALIKLNVHNDLLFLSKHKHYLSFWDMNMLMKIGRESQYRNIQIERLIQSDNPRVAALGVALACETKQLECKEMIRKKIGHSDEILNQEALKAYLSMATENDEFEFVIQQYAAANISIKSIIVNSLSFCRDKNITIPFWVRVIEGEPLLLKAAAMKQLLSADISRLHTYKTSEDTDIIKAYKQVIDFNIK